MDKLWNFTALSFAAQIITFPLSIYYFHQFPVYFLFGNLFITLPLIAMMYLGIAILVPFLSFLAPIFEWIINFVNMGLKWISNLPLSTLSSIWISLPQFILLSIALSCFIYAVFHYHKRILFCSLVSFIAYISLTTYDDLQAFNQRKIIFFTLRKNYAIAFINGRETILLTDLNIIDKNYEFFVKPALEQSQINAIDFVNIKRDTSLKDFVLKDKQITFRQYKMLLIDETYNHKKINGEANFSAIWLHNNTSYNINDLKQGITYKTIIADASNKDYKIKIFRNFALNNKIDIHVLKKNKAYLVDLNP